MTQAAQTTQPDSAPAAAAPPGAEVATILLAEPIRRDGAEPITQLALRKPRAGELRGLRLQDLTASDANALITLIPRISQPFISEIEAANLAAEDFAEVGGAVLGFFMSPALKAMIAQMQGG